MERNDRVQPCSDTAVGPYASSEDMAGSPCRGSVTVKVIVAFSKEVARLLGIDRSFGTLQEEKYADFLILNDNPLRNIDTLSDIDQVYKGGHLA